MFWLFGKKAQYPSLSWGENFIGGHVTFGSVTIFGANAMHFAVNIRTKRWGSICFTLPVFTKHRKRMGYYFYVSSNATPWASTFYIGSDKYEAIRAQIRRLNFGHNIDTHNEEVYRRLRCLNEKFEWFKINDYDLLRFGK